MSLSEQDGDYGDYEPKAKKKLTPTPAKQSTAEIGGNNSAAISGTGNDDDGSPTSRKRKLAVIAPYVVNVNTMRHGDVINAEQTLQRLISASMELIAYESNDMEGHADQWDPNRSCQMHYANFMKNFRQSISPALTYLNKLPAYSVMPDQDRALLFSQSLLPFLFTQLCLPANSEYAFFGFNKFNRQLCLKAFPEYELFVDAVDEICQVFKAWKPTKIEISLLLALFFYQSELLDKISHPQLVVNVNQRLKTVLHGVVSNAVDSNNRLRYFMRAYDLVRETPSICTEVSSAVYKRFSNNNNNDGNENFPCDPLFMEIYSKRQFPAGKPNLMKLISSAARKAYPQIQAPY